MATNKGFRFASWLAVVHYAETQPWFYYQAPMDYAPCRVRVCRVFKNGKIRIAGPDGYKYTIDRAHVDRCSYPG